MQFPDFGPMQFLDFGPMQWARPNMCFMCYCMVCGSLGGSSLSFVLTVSVLFQVLPLVREKAWDDDMAHTTVSVSLGVHSDILTYLTRFLI